MKKFYRILAALVALMLMCCCAVAEEAPAAEDPEAMYTSVLLSNLQMPYESWFAEGMPACFAVTLLLDATFAQAFDIVTIMETYAAAPEAYVCEYAGERNGKIIELYLFFADVAEDGTSAGGTVVNITYNAEAYVFIGTYSTYVGAPAETVDPLVENETYTAAHHVPVEEFAMTLAYMNQLFTGQPTVE